MKLSGMLKEIMPVGAGGLFFIQMFSTLGYSVLYSTLMLYMTGALGFSAIEANNVTGVFIAFNYALHLLGGYFGGRFLTNRVLFCVGMLAQCVGAFLLMVPTHEMLYWGLACFLTGAGLNVTCLNCMVTQLFESNDTRRETVFMWNYSGMNIGFFTGFAMSGFFQLTGEYHRLFFWSALGYVVAFILVMMHWKKLADRVTFLSKATQLVCIKRGILGVGLVVSLIPIIYFFAQHAVLGNNLVLFVGALMLLILLVLAKKQSPSARYKMISFILFSLAALVFWSLYHLQVMGLSLFIIHNVQNTLWGHTIPPQWIENLNTIVIVLGAPILSLVFRALRKRGYIIALPLQFAIALLLIGIGFVILPLGIMWANPEGLVNFNWVVACYLLQSSGELFIGPIGYAMIGQLAPVSLQGVMMGTWMMLIGVGGAMAHYFSNMMVASESISPLVTNIDYSHTFALIGWAALLAGGILLMSYRLLYALTLGKSRQ